MVGLVGKCDQCHKEVSNKWGNFLDDTICAVSSSEPDFSVTTSIRISVEFFQSLSSLDFGDLVLMYVAVFTNTDFSVWFDLF